LKEFWKKIVNIWRRYVQELVACLFGLRCMQIRVCLGPREVRRNTSLITSVDVIETGVKFSVARLFNLIAIERSLAIMCC